MSFLTLKVLFSFSMFETRGLVKLVRLSGEYLALSSWWSKLTEKLTVSGRMYLLSDMATGAKREIRPKTLGVPSLFLYFPGLFSFALALKCGDFYILGLFWRDVKSRHALLRMVNPALLHLD